MRKFTTRLTIQSAIAAIGFSLMAFTPGSDNADPNIGIYVDNVKVTELSCYTFKKMTVVLPYDTKFDAFDHLTITFNQYEVNEIRRQSFIELSIAAIKAKYLKNGYIVYDFFTEESKDKNDLNAWHYTFGLPKMTRDDMKFYYGGEKKKESSIYIGLFGSIKTGEIERYDQGCQCYRKEPTFEQTSLNDDIRIEIPLLDREKAKPIPFTTMKTNEKIDLNQPCDIPGTKVDFNNLTKTK